MSLPHIPVLRRGEPYESMDCVEIHSVRTGEPVATVSHANAGLIRRDLRRLGEARNALASLPAARLLGICSRAAELFMDGILPLGPGGGLQSPAEYVEALSATSGLPHTLVRGNMGKIYEVFVEMQTILRGLTRGLDLRVIDQGFGEQGGVPVSYYAVSDALGVVLPSNSPGVNTLWMPSIALKIPVVLKPGREEPWTPYRVIQAFIAAGCPPAAFSFYPTDHEGSSAVMEGCSRALIFGDEATVQRYAGHPGVQVHGPGRSKILIGADMAGSWPEFLGLMAGSIVSNGGRSCINASAILIPAHARELAEALAEKLATIRPVPAAHEGAVLSGFANPKMAESIDDAIETGLRVPGAEEVTARFRGGPRKVFLEGSTYLLPTLVHCGSFDHPLANREFLFPYASVTEVPQERMLDVMGHSLVVTVLSEDDRFLQDVIASPLIDRLNIGPLPTTLVQWDQPHEGNLFEFLYRRRAIQRGGSGAAPRKDNEQMARNG